MTQQRTIPDPSTLPASLTELPQWVCWKSIPDRAHPEKKPKKLPIDAATGKAASSTDPATWGSYAECAEVAARRRLAGIGFVFTPEDPFTGVDLDGCLDPETGAVTSWAAPWLGRLLAAGYGEISPSGTGVKVIVRGSIPKALSQKDRFGPHQGIEVYDRGRYFTLTGQIVEGSVAEPGDGQAILDDLFATYDQPEPAPELPAPAPVAPAAAPLPATGWRQDRARAVDERIGVWVKDCLDWARREMKDVPEGAKHNRRLQLGRFLGGVVAAAPGHLSADEALGVLYGAKVPSSHHSQEIRAIRDGLTTGMGQPLTPGAVGDKDGRDYLPTDDDIVVQAGRACCPRCTTPVRRSRYGYPGSTTPGWYCPQCKGSMIWPSSAWSGPALVGDDQSTPKPSRSEAGAPDAHPLFKFYRGAEIDQIVAPRQLVKGYLTVGTVGILIGPSEAGKSTIAVDLANKVAPYYTVFYIAAEDGANVRSQLRAWELTHNQPRSENFILVDGPILLAVDNQVDAFIAAAVPHAPRLIVIDTLSACIPGVDENSPEMTGVSHNLNRIADSLGASVLVLHHPLKSDAGTYRGHSSLLNNTHTMLVAEREAGDDVVMLKVVRHKGRRAEPTALRIVLRPTDIVDPDEGVLEAPVALPARRVMLPADHLSARQRAILQFLADTDADGGATVAEICRTIAGEFKTTEGNVRRDVASLVKRSLMTASGKQREPRQITSGGQSLIKSDRVDQADQVNPLDPFVVNTRLNEELTRSDNLIAPAGYIPLDMGAVGGEPDHTRSEPDHSDHDQVPDPAPNLIHSIRSFRSDRVDQVGGEGEGRSPDRADPQALPDQADLYWDDEEDYPSPQAPRGGAAGMAARLARRKSEREVLADRYEELTGKLLPGAPTLEQLRELVQDAEEQAKVQHPAAD